MPFLGYNMIPRIIHYCWFGRTAKPDLVNNCIKSWRKICKDFRIVEWNENNFDVQHAPLYVREAYSAKKWAFVSDYVRLHVLTKYGGIYLDTDVELLRPLTSFLSHRAFAGFEDDNRVAAGIMGCEKNYPFFENLLRSYNQRHFYRADGSMDLMTNVVVFTEKCSDIGMVLNNSYQVVDGFALYPKEFFYPLDYGTGRMRKTDNTIAIHWYAASWQEEKDRIKFEKERKLRRVFGYSLGDLIFGISTSIENEGLVNYIKRHLQR